MKHTHNQGNFRMPETLRYHFSRTTVRVDCSYIEETVEVSWRQDSGSTPATGKPRNANHAQPKLPDEPDWKTINLPID